MPEPAVPLGGQFEISYCNVMKAVPSVASSDDWGAGDPIDQATEVGEEGEGGSGSSLRPFVLTVLTTVRQTKTEHKFSHFMNSPSIK